MTPEARDLAVVVVALFFANVLLRALVVAVAPPGRRPLDGPSLPSLVVLGSGGHTAEMFAILRALDPRRYAPRAYVVADTDHTSVSKVERHEASVGAALADSDATDAELERWTSHAVVRLPRSREVGQSYLLSVFTTLRAIIAAFALVLRERPRVVLCNGPGTCLPVCVAAFVAKCLPEPVGRAPVVVFVESVARVQSLSLTGKLLYHLRLADEVFVQWETLAERYPRTTLAGRVV